LEKALGIRRALFHFFPRFDVDCPDRMLWVAVSFAQAKLITLKIGSYSRKAELLSDCNRIVAMKNDNLCGD